MKNNLILGLAAVSMLAFASCEKENPNGKTPEGGVVEGIPTTATITLTNPPSTMATEADTAAESALAEATLYVFNNADVLESIVAFADINTKAQKFETTTGAKRLFVCANMNALTAPFNFKTVTTAANPGEVTTLDAFKKSMLTIANFDVMCAANKFWMTNLEAQPAQVTVTETSANNTFTVQIGRMCAKVELTMGAGVVGSGGQLTSVKFKTKNNPNKMYLMPVYDGNNYTGKQLLTPYYKTATSGTYISGNSVNIGSSTYLSENSNEEIKAGKATYLEVEGIWTPDKAQTLNPDGTPATAQLTTGANFWRIAQYDGDPSQPASKITGYKAGCYNANPQANQIGANQKAIPYTGGKCFYAIYVQDKNAGTDKELALRYTIKRNTLFKVVISSISGPGASDAPGVVPDPDKPVETVVQMDVTISVADWTVANLSAGI